MTRSVWKPPFVDGYLIKAVNKYIQTTNSRPVKTRSRRSTIIPLFVGVTFEVYNGHKYIPVQVKEEMIGHKLGEFSPTRIFHGHGADKKAKKD